MMNEMECQDCKECKDFFENIYHILYRDFYKNGVSPYSLDSSKNE